MQFLIRTFFLLFLTSYFMPAAQAADQHATAVNSRFTADGSNTIYFSADASAPIQAAAKDLAEKLRLATGQEFSLQQGGHFSGKGFYLGVRGSNEVQNIPEALTKMGKEGIYIRGNTQGVSLIGNSDLAVQEAVYTYLHQIGFRFYFPHPAWHIIPKNPKLFTDFTLLTQPDYASRSIWYAYGTNSKKADEDYRNWTRYNRMGGAFTPNTKHAYDGIVNRNKAVFDKHPEFFAKNADGSFSAAKAKEKKFCQSNEELVQLCIKDALQQIEKSRAKGGEGMQMVSMDPSDGWASCECANCRKLGSPSDRVFYLVNRVAKEVGRKYPGKWVGLYAYASHAEPTHLTLEPNVFVMVATAFNKTKYSTGELINEWGKRASKIGIRDYYGVMAWDWDMPGNPSGAKLSFVKKNLSKHHEQGAIALSAETNIGWISRGLGHYVASQLAWDTKKDVNALAGDFYKQAFGEAREPMEKLYSNWQTHAEDLPTADQIAQWYGWIEEGKKLARDPGVKERISQVEAYMHYVALFHNWKAAPADGKTKALNDLLAYTHQVKDLGVCATYPLQRRLIPGLKDPKYKYNDPNAFWKHYQLTEKDLKNLSQSYLGRVKDLVPETAYSSSYELVSHSFPSAVEKNRYRGGHQFLAQLPADPAARYLEVSTGYVYKDKPASVQVYALNADVTESKSLLNLTIPGDKALHKVDLSKLPVGTYKVMINDSRAGINMKAGPGVILSVLADQQHKLVTRDRSAFYFYVPKGTKRFEIIKSGFYSLTSPSGKTSSYDTAPMSVKIEVTEKDYGVWKISNQKGTIFLRGIPPVLGVSAGSLLVPKEVMDAKQSSANK